MKISDLSVEGLLITGWLYKKYREHKNKPPEPPQKHPKGCYIAVLLFFLIGLALIIGDYFVDYYRRMDGQKSQLFELYAEKEFCGELQTPEIRRVKDNMIEALEDSLFSWDLKKIQEEYRALPPDHAFKKKWQQNAIELKKE